MTRADRDRLLERLTSIANDAKSRGWDDVASWIGAHLAQTIRDDRPRRKRQLEVTLPRSGRKIKIDADKLKEAKKCE